MKTIARFAVGLLVLVLVALVSRIAFAENPPAGQPEAAINTKTPKLIKAIKESLISAEEQVSPWVNTVRFGQERGFLENVCSELNAFESKSRAFKQMREYGISWAELETEISKEVVQEAFALDGKKVVKHLLQALKMPSSTRDGVYCFKHALPDFGDGIAVLEIIIERLEEIGATPTDIESTETELRQIALVEFRYQIGLGRTKRASDTMGFSRMSVVLESDGIFHRMSYS